MVSLSLPPCLEWENPKNMPCSGTKKFNYISYSGVTHPSVKQNYVLYCIVLYCIVLYCIGLHCIVLYCIALYCIVLHWIAFYCIVLYCIVLHCIVLYCIVLRGWGFPEKFPWILSIKVYLLVSKFSNRMIISGLNNGR